MLKKLLSQKLLVLSCLATLLLWLPDALHAQASCSCPDTRPFGSCVHKTEAYPDTFPGSAAVVKTGTTTYLYVADLFNGFTYRYDATTFDREAPFKFPSPRGSNATTGITGYPAGGGDISLYWAVENVLYRTNLDGGEVFEVGLVRLDQLAGALRTDTGDEGIGTGSLGGITFHSGSATLWGADIVNDVYFEFDETGNLVLDDGMPTYFFNPKRNPLTGGAYGNTITYAVSGGKDYFDIPVGSLVDGRPTAVHRVHASDGVAPETHKIGDDTGVLYLMEDLDSPKFVTGVAFWRDSCAEGQHSEFLLDLDEIGGSPQILELSADEPTAANIADFICSNVESTTVTLTWRKTLPYTSLRITRQRVNPPAVPPVVVFESTDFASDPETFEDTGVLDGSYEYIATVMATQPVPPVTCRTTVGLGSLVAYERFSGSLTTTEPSPYPMTVVQEETVVAVDFDSGDAETFDLALNPTGTIRGPFDSGATTGIAYAPFDAGQAEPEPRLYWLQNLEGRFFLYVTDLNGDQLTSPVPVYGPDSLNANIQLGDLSYDAERDVFWTVDLLNESIYAITAMGETASGFEQQQFPSPEPGGHLSGGVAVVSATPTSVILDIPVGSDDDDDLVDQIVRVQYDPTDPSAAGREIWRLDLVSSVGAANVSGVALVDTPTNKFEYVAAMDTSTIYSLQLTLESEGLVTFRRGDINNDDSINISDPSFLLEHLFRQGTAPTCMTAADADDSESVDITDAIYLFNYLFMGGPQPPEPFVACGVDLESQLECPEAFCTG